MKHRPSAHNWLYVEGERKAGDGSDYRPCGLYVPLTHDSVIPGFPSLLSRAGLRPMARLPSSFLCSPHHRHQPRCWVSLCSFITGQIGRIQECFHVYTTYPSLAAYACVVCVCVCLCIALWGCVCDVFLHEFFCVISGTCICLYV